MAGDSGGPLNWQDPATGRVYMIGITSFGIGCAKPDVPGVYTKVTNYLDWIQQQTGNQTRPTGFKLVLLTKSVSKRLVKRLQTR